MRPGFNVIGEITKATKNGHGLLIPEDLPGLIHTIQTGDAAHTPSKKVSAEAHTLRGHAAQLHPIADLSRRPGNEVPYIAVRQQM